MSDSEALMWNIEKDPAMSSWFASLSMLDTAPSMDRLRTRLLYVSSEIPRLRQRVAASLGRLAPPHWVDDLGFDIDYHVRRIGVPGDGGMDDLAEVAVNILLDPFERTRPLWQFIVLDGLADGRAALIQKMHHTITDGEGGVRLAERFVDVEREARDPDPRPVSPREQPVGRVLQSSLEMLGHNTRRLSGVARRTATSAITDPVGSARRTAKVAGEAAKMIRPPRSGLTVGSSLWQPRTLRRWFGMLDYPLDAIKAAGKDRDGTINDVFVAGALAGAAAYHADRGVGVDRFRVAMPVSTRTGGTAGGNSFSLTTAELDAMSDPEAAFVAVKEGLASVKSGDSVDILGSLAGIINLLPTSVLAATAKDLAGQVDFTVSNVRGAPFPIYIAGARCEAVYPMGPISGTAFNLTTLSYDGSLDMGLVVDAGAIDDPVALRGNIAAAYESLLG